jgi:hypothetical protein
MVTTRVPITTHNPPPNKNYFLHLKYSLQKVFWANIIYAMDPYCKASAYKN